MITHKDLLIERFMSPLKRCTRLGQVFCIGIVWPWFCFRYMWRGFALAVAWILTIVIGGIVAGYLKLCIKDGMQTHFNDNWAENVLLGFFNREDHKRYLHSAFSYHKGWHSGIPDWSVAYDIASALVIMVLLVWYFIPK